MINKDGFSYLELMIAMTLVVIIAILSAPLMTGMGKNSTPIYGEYKCYARLVDGNWKLFQNQRINTDTYPAEDVEIPDGESCIFIKPVGNIGSYTITLYGGGGSGSMPYFSLAKSDGINFVPGQNGKAGEEKSIVDRLIFNTDGEMKIEICDDDLTNKNCVGKGGETNKKLLSMAPYERMLNIKTKLVSSGEINESDKNFISSLETDDCAKTNTRMEKFLSATSPNNIKTYREKFINSIPDCASSIKDKTAYTGYSGKPSKITLSDNKTAIALGGLYGISDGTLDVKTYTKADFTQGKNKLFYIPKTSNATIESNKFKNCHGEDANNPANIDTYDNFGAGGGRGAFACKIKEWNNLNLLNQSDNIKSQSNNKVTTVDNECYMGYGGAGAGGAIVIEWN